MYHRCIGLLAVLLLGCTPLLFAKVDDYHSEGEYIKVTLSQSMQAYQNGNEQEAKRLAEKAYFQHFENIEGTIARNIGKQAYFMEKKFNLLRNLYKNKADIERIEALVAGLVFDLEQVIPLLDSSMKLVAEVSDANYDKAAAEAASIEAEKQRSKEADEMFARLLGEVSDANDIGESVNPPTAAIAKLPTQNAMQEIENASKIDAKLAFLYDEISAKFDIAALRLRNAQAEQAATVLETDVLFNSYRNTKLEVVINKFSDSKKAQGWQVRLKEIIRKLKANGITEKELRTELTSLSDDLFALLLLIPNDEIGIVQVEGFKQESLNVLDYNNVANDISIALNKIIQKYQQSPAELLIEELQGVYLDIFEASQMENKIGAVDSNLKLAIESKFTQGVALIKANASANELEANFIELNRLISRSVELIEDLSPTALIIASLVIILREGLEAMLIVLAIAAYLTQSGNANRINIVYSALGVGVFLSFVTAFVVHYFFAQFAGQFRELLEGLTMIVALFLLLYVGFWLLSKSYKWNSYIQSQAKEAMNKGSSRILWWTVFLAVYREGAETVLFYQALFFSANSTMGFWAVIGGLIAGSGILVVLYLLLKSGAIKIPIKLFFQVTSYLIFVMCFAFAGKAIAELIEGKLIMPTFVPISFEPIVWLGIYPYYETLMPQIFVVLVIAAGMALTHRLISQQKEKKI